MRKKRQALFFEGLGKEAEVFQKPILYVHGDEHEWERKNHFKADNMTRIQLDRTAEGGPLHITMTTDSSIPFLLDPPIEARKKKKKAKKEKDKN